MGFQGFIAQSKHLQKVDRGQFGTRSRPGLDLLESRLDCGLNLLGRKKTGLKLQVLQVTSSAVQLGLRLNQDQHCSQAELVWPGV